MQKETGDLRARLESVQASGTHPAKRQNVISWETQDDDLLFRSPKAPARHSVLAVKKQAKGFTFSRLAQPQDMVSCCFILSLLTKAEVRPCKKHSQGCS